MRICARHGKGKAQEKGKLVGQTTLYFFLFFLVT